MGNLSELHYRREDRSRDGLAVRTETMNQVSPTSLPIGMQSETRKMRIPNGQKPWLNSSMMPSMMVCRCGVPASQNALIGNPYATGISSTQPWRQEVSSPDMRWVGIGNPGDMHGQQLHGERRQQQRRKRARQRRVEAAAGRAFQDAPALPAPQSRHAIGIVTARRALPEWARSENVVTRRGFGSGAASAGTRNPPAQTPVSPSVSRT